MKKIVIELVDGKKMNLELYEDIAPITVANFMKLIAEKFFDGLIFHRVINHFMIQGGGFYIENRSLEHKEAPSIKGEFASNGVENNLKHTPGVISMARANDKNSASSQFFICIADCQHLDGEYAGFGKIADKASLDVAYEIGRARTTRIGYMADFPVEPIIIKTIKEVE